MTMPTAAPPCEDTPAWFQVVEIEVSSHCNRRCAYCPQSQDWFRKPQHFLDRSVFESIIDQLAELEFSGRLSFHMYNEPLLHPQLEDLVAHARGSLPGAWLVLYTNGDLLDDRRHAALLQAGIDHFLVTRHSGRSFAERPFQQVRQAGDFMLSNRGGLVGAPVSWNLPCYGPSEMLMIHHDGTVVLCHEDAAGQRPMGRVDRQSLREIWQSEEFVRLRALLEAGDRRGAGHQCAVCDNRLHPLPDTAI